MKVGGNSVNNLRCADDSVLTIEYKEFLQHSLDVLEEVSRKKGFELNSKKTEVMFVSIKQ